MTNSGGWGLVSGIEQTVHTVLTSILSALGFYIISMKHSTDGKVITVLASRNSMLSHQDGIITTITFSVGGDTYCIKRIERASVITRSDIEYIKSSTTLTPQELAQELSLMTNIDARPSLYLITIEKTTPNDAETENVEVKKMNDSYVIKLPKGSSINVYTMTLMDGPKLIIVPITNTTQDVALVFDAKYAKNLIKEQRDDGTYVILGEPQS